MKKVEEFEKRRFDEEIWRIQVRKGKEMKLNPEAEEFRRENCQEDIWQNCCMGGMIRSLRRSI